MLSWDVGAVEGDCSQGPALRPGQPTAGGERLGPRQGLMQLTSAPAKTSRAGVCGEAGGSTGSPRRGLEGSGGGRGPCAHAHLILISCFGGGGAAREAEARDGRSRLCTRSKDMDTLRRSLRGVTASLWD